MNASPETSESPVWLLQSFRRAGTDRETEARATEVQGHRSTHRRLSSAEQEAGCTPLPQPSPVPPLAASPAQSAHRGGGGPHYPQANGPLVRVQAAGPRQLEQAWAALCPVASLWPLSVSSSGCLQVNRRAGGTRTSVRTSRAGRLPLWGWNGWVPRGTVGRVRGSWPPRARLKGPPAPAASDLGDPDGAESRPTGSPENRTANPREAA